MTGKCQIEIITIGQIMKKIDRRIIIVAAFVFIVGRVGMLELTATNIAWRINGIAFFPIVGVSQAIASIIVIG